MQLPDIGLAWGTLHQASLIETIEVAARFGFPTLQIPPDIYFDALEAGMDSKALRRRLADTDVQVRLIDAITAGVPGMPTEPVVFKGRAMQRFDVAVCCEVAEALEAPIVNLSHYLGQPVPIEQMAEATSGICRYAAKRNITIVLEFMPGSGIRTLGEAHAIAQACGEPNCKVLLDTWHLTRSGGTANDVRALAPHAIGAFQLSDRKTPPPNTPYVPMTGRLLPGEGELPLTDIIDATLSNSPDISLELEVFSEELGRLTVDAAAARTADAVRRWKQHQRSQILS